MSLLVFADRVCVEQGCESSIWLARVALFIWRYSVPVTRVSRAVLTRSTVMLWRLSISRRRPIWVVSRWIRRKVAPVLRTMAWMTPPVAVGVVDGKTELLTVVGQYGGDVLTPHHAR